MLILTITLTTLLSVFFGILYAQLDGHIVLLRKERDDTRTLPHNSRAALRGVFAFLLGVLGITIMQFNPNYESWTFFLFGLLSFVSIAIPFDIVYNGVVGNKWDYLSSDEKGAWWDRFFTKSFGEDAGIVSIMVKVAAWLALFASLIVIFKF